MATNPNLGALERAVRFNTRCTTGLLALFVVLLICLGVYTYARASRTLKAENLVQTAENRIRKSYPEVRSDLKQAITRNAPALAEKLSQRTLKNIPDARERLERYLERKIEAGLEKATAFSAREFRALLRENRELILQAYRELREAPEETRKFVVRMEKVFENWAGTDIQRDARIVLGFLYLLRDKLDKLNRDENELTPKQKVERRIVRGLRALEAR